jgi:hypothetical protein
MFGALFCRLQGEAIRLVLQPEQSYEQAIPQGFTAAPTSAYRAHISHCYPVLLQVTLPVHANVTNASDFRRQVPP